MTTYQRYVEAVKRDGDRDVLHKRETRLYIRYACKAYDVLGTWDGTAKQNREAAPREFRAWRLAFVVAHGFDPV